MVRYLFYTIGDLTYQSPLVAGVEKAVQSLPVESAEEAKQETVRII